MNLDFVDSYKYNINETKNNNIIIITIIIYTLVKWVMMKMKKKY